MYACIKPYLFVLYLQYIDGNREVLLSDRIVIKAQITRFTKISFSNSCLWVRFAKFVRVIEKRVRYLR